MPTYVNVKNTKIYKNKYRNIWRLKKYLVPLHSNLKQKYFYDGKKENRRSIFGRN